MARCENASPRKAAGNLNCPKIVVQIQGAAWDAYPNDATLGATQKLRHQASKMGGIRFSHRPNSRGTGGAAPQPIGAADRISR
jgi:hypothetical protein